MIRKMLVIAAAVAMPATALAGVSAVAASGNAFAGKPLVVAHITCNISGSIAFGGGGITENGDASADKASTTTVTLSGTGTGCQAAPLTSFITQKSTKCKGLTLVPLPPSAGAFAGLTPGFTQFPGCVPLAAKKYTLSNSAWGFLSGTDSHGVPQNTLAGIAKALHKGVTYYDNNVKILLTVSGVNAIQPSGACGSGIGFALNGTVKKSPADTWTINLCLTGDSGSGTSNSFLGDLVNQVVATHNNTANTSVIQTATVASPSQLIIN